MLPLGGPRAEKGWAHTDRSLPKASWNAQMHPMISALPYPDPGTGKFGAFGAVYVTRTRHHKQLSCLTLRVSHRVWIEPEEWLSTSYEYVSAFGAFGAVSLPLTRHHKQLSCLTLRVSHRAWIEPGEWLNTKPSTSPRGATPTHAGRWGSAWRTPPDLQTTEATGFSPKPDRLQAGDRIGDWRLGEFIALRGKAVLTTSLM